MVLLNLPASMQAQGPEKIRFKKDLQYIYFFQKAAQSDTIIKNKTDVFYLLVPDSLKAHLIIASENACISKLTNDSLVLCKYLPGLRYEQYYLLSDEEQVWKYRSGINGAAVVPREKILIQFLDKRTNKVIFENSFVAIPN